MNLPDVTLKDTRDPGLLDFIDYVRIIINTGKYGTRVVTSIPTGDGNSGESLLYWDGSTTYRLYLYVNSGWHYINFDG